MPFTLAHPAAAIPLLRPLGRLGVLSALVVGSLMPDLPYFVPMALERGATHSLAGLLWFCVPVGLLVYAIFHALIKAPCCEGLAALAPPPLAERLRKMSEARAVRSVGVGVSVLAGAATHVVWDSFTHADGFLVAAWHVLATRLFSVGSYDVAVFKVLQHASSGIGLLVLGGALANWIEPLGPFRWTHLPPVTRRVVQALAAASALTLLGAAALLSAAPEGEALATLREAVGRSIVLGGRLVLGGVLVGCAVWWLGAKRGRRVPS
jgi:hypothetical protein